MALCAWGFSPPGRDSPVNSQGVEIMQAKVFTIIFRIHGGDVYEIPVEAKTYAAAQARALAFVGISRHAVTICKA
jgi:hypothetical protein